MKLTEEMIYKINCFIQFLIIVLINFLKSHMRLNICTFVHSTRVFQDLSLASKSLAMIHCDYLEVIRGGVAENVDVQLGSLSVGVVLKHPPEVYDHRVLT